MEKMHHKLFLTVCLMITMFALLMMPVVSAAVVSAASVKWIEPCDSLYARLKAAYSSNCGDEDYDPIPDIDKNGRVELLDFMNVAEMHDKPEECKAAIDNNLSPCGPCGNLFYRLKASYDLECEDDKYDPIADINKDGKVNLGDLGMLAGIYDDEEKCEEILKDTTTPCDQDPTTSLCSDSDGGLNYNEKGYLDVSSGSISVYLPDFCKDDQKLVEYYCLDSQPKSTTYNCEYGCKDGHCLKEVVTSGCTDSDGGKDYNELGRVKITSINGVTLYTDHCLSNGQLFEYFCSENSVAYVTYSCGEGYSCNDGACVKEDNEGNQCTNAGYKCTSSVRGCGHYDEIDLDCGTSSLVCCEEIPYCGDGVCFRHSLEDYGETEETCPEDCHEESSCASNGEELRPTPDKYKCCEGLKECHYLDEDEGEFENDGGPYGVCLEKCEYSLSGSTESGGYDIYQKGYLELNYLENYDSNTNGNKKSYYEDTCLGDGKTLIEYYITEDKNGNVFPESDRVKCEYGCNDGACLKKPKPVSSCSDSDGGINYAERGVLTKVDSRGNMGTYSDYCVLGRVLKEYYCYDDTVRHTYHYCREGLCLSGACVSDATFHDSMASRSRLGITGRTIEDINQRGIFERITDAFVVLVS